jgi:hypothetical protein
MHPLQCKVFIVPPEQLQAHMLNALNKQETNVLVWHRSKPRLPYGNCYYDSHSNCSGCKRENRGTRGLALVSVRSKLHNVISGNYLSHAMRAASIRNAHNHPAAHNLPLIGCQLGGVFVASHCVCTSVPTLYGDPNSTDDRLPVRGAFVAFFCAFARLCQPCPGGNIDPTVRQKGDRGEQS